VVVFLLLDTTKYDLSGFPAYIPMIATGYCQHRISQTGWLHVNHHLFLYLIDSRQHDILSSRTLTIFLKTKPQYNSYPSAPCHLDQYRPPNLHPINWVVLVQHSCDFFSPQDIDESKQDLSLPLGHIQHISLNNRSTVITVL